MRQVALATHIGGPVESAVTRLRPRVGFVLIAALLFGAAGWALPAGIPRMLLFLVAGILATAAGWIWLVSGISAVSRRRRARMVAELVAQDAVPSVLTGAEGRILKANPAAERLFGTAQAETLGGLLGPHVANPGALAYRLETRARAGGTAHEDVVTRQAHYRVSLRQIDPVHFLWRLERSGALEPRTGEEIRLPMLTLGRNDAILFMNTAARDLVGERARSLDRICPDLPVRSGQRVDISTRQGPARCLVLELEASAGRRELFLLPDEAGAERAPDGWAFFDELPVPLLKLDPSGALELSNRPARKLLGVETCDGRMLADMLEGLGRPISDWLAEAGRGPRRAPVRVPQGAPPGSRGLRAGDPQPDRRGWRERPDRGPERCHGVQVAGTAVRPEPENGGHRTARGGRGARFQQSPDRDQRPLRPSAAPA